MSDWLRSIFAGRPAWMNALMAFCAFMAFVYVPWDFFLKPVSSDQEVWFGILFTGWAAKLTEPLHFGVYAAGAYGFRHMRPWMWPWAAAYVAQVAFGMLVWSAVTVGGFSGALMGLVAALPFAGLAWLLWRSREAFQQPRATLRERYGDWALITGASSGIGAEFARALARDGMSCVLAARREERLRSLAAELERDFRVETRVVADDLTQPDCPLRLARAVADLPIGVLVNNAGFGYAGRFDRLDPERLRAMIQVNCAAPVLLSRSLLPGMLERGRGAIVVTGSVAGRQPLPLHGVYSATKAFDLLFGESLAVELEDEGIHVLVLEPGATETEFQDAAGQVPHTGQSAQAVVRVALDALGRRPSVVSGWFNWVRAGVATRLLPRSLVPYLARDLMARQTPPEMR